MIELLMDNELEIIWKEMVMSWKLRGETEEIHGTPEDSRRDLNRGHS
jgi:hypothetical protein